MKRERSEKQIEEWKRQQEEQKNKKTTHELAKEGEAIRLNKVKTGMVFYQEKTRSGSFEIFKNHRYNITKIWKTYKLITSIERFGGLITKINFINIEEYHSNDYVMFDDKILKKIKRRKNVNIPIKLLKQKTYTSSLDFEAIDQEIQWFDDNVQIDVYKPIQPNKNSDVPLTIYQYIDEILDDSERHKEIKPIIASVIEDGNNKKVLDYIKKKLWNMPRKSMATPRQYEIKYDMCYYDKKKVREVEIVTEGRFRVKSFHNEFFTSFQGQKPSSSS